VLHDKGSALVKFIEIKQKQEQRAAEREAKTIDGRTGDNTPAKSHCGNGRSIGICAKE